MLNSQLYFRKKKILYHQEKWRTPNSERFTNATTQLSTSKHVISLFHRTLMMNYSWDPISDAYCVWWQSLRLLSPGKLGRFAAGTVLCAIQGPAVCSRVTGAAQAVPVASAVETAVCPPSVMAEMCGRLLPNSMPLPTSHRHTHTHHSHAVRHTQRGVKKPQDFGTRMSNALGFRIALYLVCKTIGTEAVASKSKPVL